jgi:hypothetical protein
MNDLHRRLKELRGEMRSPGVVDGAIMVLPICTGGYLAEALLSVASRTWANTAVIGAASDLADHRYQLVVVSVPQLV